MAIRGIYHDVEVRDAFPKTSSGKIQKYLLRDEIARLLGRRPLVR
jgi:acyl-coenzyme A synthetase/AMP-(fatty) acid ligase